MVSIRRLLGCSLLLAGVLFPLLTATALSNSVAGAVVSASSLIDDEKTLQPTDLFPDFPAVKWGMSFADAKKMIEKTGVHPATFRDSETQLIWDGTFNGVSGRATILCKADTGVWEIAVVAFAMEKQKELFSAWVTEVTKRHGAPKQVEDDSYAVSKVWRMKDGLAIELRAPKDPESPIVDIHWVKQ